MTCIVGIKTEDRIYIGADRMGSNGSTGKEYSTKKVFKKSNGFIYGYTGCYRTGQIIRHNLEEPPFLERDIDSYIFKSYIPELINCLGTHKRLKNENGVCEMTGACLIVGFKNRLMKIERPFNILENEDNFLSTGDGEEYADSILIFLKENSQMSPEDKIKKSIEITSQRVLSVNDKIDIESINITEYT